MNKYQLLYIIDNGMTDEEKNAISEKFSGKTGTRPDIRKLLRRQSDA